MARKALLTSIFVCVSAVGIHVPGLAQDSRAGVAQEASDSEEATNAALLEALLKRRAAVARSSSAAGDKRHALDFLDRQIARVRSARAK